MLMLMMQNLMIMLMLMMLLMLQLHRFLFAHIASPHIYVSGALSSNSCQSRCMSSPG